MSGPRITWETVEVFGRRGMAEVAGSALRSADIPFRIQADDGGAAMQLPFSLRTRGAELQVPAEDAANARALLGGVEVDALDMAEAYQGHPIDQDDDTTPLSRPGMVMAGRILLGLALLAITYNLLTSSF
ncbi:hypothetical protein BH23ACT9_BH23ACT9_24530 [soil metagenome]